MQVTIELPDEIADEIRKSTPDVGRRVLEGFAVEGYRSGALTGSQVRHLLGLRNRLELFSQASERIPPSTVPRNWSATSRTADVQAMQSASARDRHVTIDCGHVLFAV
jgi:hypothetical protein